MNPKWGSKCEEWRKELELLLGDSDQDVMGTQKIIYVLNDKTMITRAGEHRAPGEDRSFHTIRLSPWMTDDEAKETFGHEYAHAVTFVLCGMKTGHGKEWRKIMCILGLAPDKGHNYPLKVRRDVLRSMGLPL